MTDITQDIEVLEKALAASKRRAEEFVMSSEFFETANPARISRILIALDLAQERARIAEAGWRVSQVDLGMQDAKICGLEAKLARAVELLDEANNAVHYMADECCHKEAAALAPRIDAFLKEAGER